MESFKEIRNQVRKNIALKLVERNKTREEINATVAKLLAIKKDIKRYQQCLNTLDSLTPQTADAELKRETVVPKAEEKPMIPVDFLDIVLREYIGTLAHSPRSCAQKEQQAQPAALTPANATDKSDRAVIVGQEVGTGNTFVMGYTGDVIAYIESHNVTVPLHIAELFKGMAERYRHVKVYIANNVVVHVTNAE